MSVETVMRMMREVEAGAPVAFASPVNGYPPLEQTLVCHFDFEPCLRYMRYVSGFNKSLNEYTSFDFTVCAIRHGCIDVTFYARNFSEREKNLVRRQISRLIDECNVLEVFNISSMVIFGKHVYPKYSKVHHG